MNTISVLGIDLAKKVFQLHGNDQHGQAVLKKQLTRKKLMNFIANLPPCLIGVEACSGSNYWAREFQKCGHTVKQISPQFVKPYVKSNKNDAADAEAIAEAVTRPNMRFVAIKQKEHHDIQTIHRVRQRLVTHRVALTNEFHGLLIEYGVVLSRPIAHMRKELAEVLAPESEVIGADTKEILLSMLEELDSMQKRIDLCDSKIKAISRGSDLCRRLEEIPGVGCITSTAILAGVVDASLFKNGRQFSAWLGLVPRQHSTGGKSVLLKISKRGDCYLRMLLVHGARSKLRVASTKDDRVSKWVCEKKKTRGHNRAIVALANKNARIIWALMSSNQEYRMAA